MDAVREGHRDALWARAGEVRRRQEGEARAALAMAARARRDSAERTLEEIERRVSGPARPQGHPWRLPSGGPRLAERFLWASAEYLRMSLGAVVLVVDGRYLGPLLCGDPTRKASDLHFIFGEGPAIEAAASGTFIEVRDFREGAWRWPAFAPAALDAGVRSAWCIPLPHPQKRGLVLTFAGAEPIPYTLPRYDRLTRVTRIAQAVLIDHPGTIPAQAIHRRIRESTQRRAVIHRAAEVLAERLSIDSDSALGLMRLEAWSERRPIEDVANELVSS